MKSRTANLAVLTALVALATGCAGSAENAESAAESEGAAESAMSEDTLRQPSEEGTRALVEFAREIRDEDLEWLRRNGFEVDTVFDRTVRGVLKDPQGSEVIVKDPRVVSVEALMR